MDGIHAGGKRTDAGAAGTKAASIACRFFGAAGAFVAGGSAEEEGSRGGGACVLRGAMAPQVLEGDSYARPRRRLLEEMRMYLEFDHRRGDRATHNTPPTKGSFSRSSGAVVANF